MPNRPTPAIDSPASYVNRELSWLAFARRVLALAEDPSEPLLERVKFAGIMGMIYDEFTMKRMGRLRRQIERGKRAPGPDGLTPTEELVACRSELRAQARIIGQLLEKELRPALAAAGLPILEAAGLAGTQQAHLRARFQESIEPVLTMLAVDAAHPFPFISNLGLNLAIQVREKGRRRSRFVRVKVPTNLSRWVKLQENAAVVPLEQVIALSLPSMFPEGSELRCSLFRVTRGAEGEPWTDVEGEEEPDFTPGALLGRVTAELTARKFAGIVRLQVSADMPEDLQLWLAAQLRVDPADVEPTEGLLALSDLMTLPVEGHAELREAPHEPVTHPRLRGLDAADPAAIFDEIRASDLLLHVPYQSFDTSVLRFLESAAVDPRVLAIKLTVYRTSSQSPIIQSLLEAARRGKQVAVVVEITARFDEAPNIAWAQRLEQAGAHVAYGVERLKTHAKLALVVRDEPDGIRRYAHIGTGNYHTGTARLYEDLGILTADPVLAAEVGRLFNELTGAVSAHRYSELVVAPDALRERFIVLVRREAEHARAGRPAGIRAKLNQLQDSRMIHELYRAGQAGVPIRLNVRGLCCLRAGVPGLSETIEVYSTLGRFLEHGRIYRFENGGEPEFYLGSADWMQRNLDRRVEAIAPVKDPAIQAELEAILRVYEEDNTSAWDMLSDGTYRRRKPLPGEPRRAAQEVFIELARRS